MAEREYKRLTFARARSIFAVAYSARSSLWLGKDHLLCVDISGFTENYKRFYFRDIQAVSIVKTLRGLIWSIVLGWFTAICVVASYAFGWGSPGGVVFLVLGLVMFTFLAINLISGTTCKTWLRTAVQNEQLPSLNRLRRARRVLNRIRPLIEQAQGRLSPEELALEMQRLATEATRMQPATSALNHPAAMAPEWQSRL